MAIRGRSEHVGDFVDHRGGRSGAIVCGRYDVGLRRLRWRHRSHGEVGVAAVFDQRAAPADDQESIAELGVHAEVDDRVVATVAHGQPMADRPYGLYIAVPPDVRVCLAQQRDRVQGQPAEGVDHDHCYHHPHHLKSFTYILWYIGGRGLNIYILQGVTKN